MNTTLKPRMNAMEFSMTLRSRWDSCVLSCSTPTPEISETYPGTSGSTHGERNDTSPARKAAMGRGRVFITESFYLSRPFTQRISAAMDLFMRGLLDSAESEKSHQRV